MVLKNSVITIEAIDDEFNGLTTLSNTAIRVPFTKIGDIIEIPETEISPPHQQPNNIITQFNLINTSYTHAPICNYYTKCGGCKAQHFNATDYKQLKINKLVNALNKYDILEKQNFSSAQINYIDYLTPTLAKRRRAIFSVRNNKIGFMQYKSNNIVEISSCPLLKDSINNVLDTIKKLLHTQQLNISSVIVNSIGKQIIITILANHKPLATDIVALQPLFNLNPTAVYWKDNNQTHKLAINATPVINYNGYVVKFSSNGFLQALEEAEHDMQKLVINSCAQSTNIIDLFCGYGGYALNLTNLPNLKNISAYDLDKEAIASINAAVSSKATTANIKAYTANLFKTPIPFSTLNNFDTAVINPPRLGAMAQIKQIAQSNINKVMAVYCSTSTLASNLVPLLDAGFNINNITIIDQFIYNPHLEILIDLGRKK